MSTETASDIESVINGTTTSVSIDMMPIREIEDFLLSHGVQELEMDGGETNGWQVDFWYTFTHPEKGRFLLNGSLHYGNFQFSKKK